jgi:hypothetical protein
MHMAAPSMLPLILKPPVFDLELWLDEFSEEQVPTQLKVVCSNSRIVVEVFIPDTICCMLGEVGV